VSRSIITLSWLEDLESNSWGVAILYRTLLLEMGYAYNLDPLTNGAGRVRA
jgi:hypothetical protein